MNITKENTDALNAVVTIKFEPEDYVPKYEKALKDYRKKASMPGFRPGSVPIGMIKKMYGKQVLLDELNRLIGDTITNYIAEEKLNVLGEPLPDESMKTIDFDHVNMKSFEVIFNLGLAPEVKCDLEKLSIPAYKLEINDAMVDQQKKMLTARFSTNETVDVVGDESMIKGKLAQDGGFEHNDTILSLRNIKDEKIAKSIKGKKVGDAIKFDIRKAYGDDSSYIAYALGINKEQADTATGDYTFTIAEITEYKDPELNQELFDQIFEKGTVTSVEEFDAKAKELVAQGNALEEDYRFGIDVKNTLQEKLKLELPEKFLRRWIESVNYDNEKATPEVIEKEFPRFLDDLRWQVTKNEIMKANSLKIERDDLMNVAKKSTRAQFMQYGLGNLPDEMLTKYAEQMLSNREQVEKMTTAASDEVVLNFIRGKAKIEEKTVSREAFNKLFDEK